MKRAAVIAMATGASLAVVSAYRSDANVVRRLSEAEATRMADLVVVADVIETNVAAPSAYRTVNRDERGDIQVSGFRPPCIRASVAARRKGRSASTILVCTRLFAEADALPARRGRVVMYLQRMGEVWLQVMGGAFRETTTR